MILKAPWMLTLLMVLPLLGKLAARSQRLQHEAAAKLRGEKSFPAHWKKQAVLQLGSFAALILALAQPAWNPHPGPAGMQGRDLVIALDISRSMLASDVFPSRLDAAKIAIFESLDHLRGQRVGLITFAGAASVRVPLTLDHNFVRYLLDRAAPSDAEVGSTSLQSAIEKAIDVALKESKKGQQDLILITDGEDYLSNIEKTADELRECGARVLIVGIGDPVAGARIPDIEKTNSWMKYKGADVVTRLDEETLKKLAAKSPNIIYYPARTRPFDLTVLYRQMIHDTSGIPGEGDRQTIYTEGYPFLIALALLLWILPMNRKIIALLTALLIAGCSPHSRAPEPDYAEHFDNACTLWAQAQTPLQTDPRASLSLLQDSRDEFLRAAMIQPGSLKAAQQSAGISAQICIVEQAVKDQEKAEEDLQQKLKQAIEELAALTQRENALSLKSQQILNGRSPTTPKEKAAAAVPARSEQASVESGTVKVINVVKETQAAIQKMLTAVYGNNEGPPPTEFDPAIALLTTANESQRFVIEALNPEARNWPQANSALLTAARRMQDALNLLSDQNKSGTPDQKSENSDQSKQDYDEGMQQDESSKDSDQSMPMSSENFKTSLESRSLPAPNYTAEEILKEEAANMEQRAQQKSSHAGANVEKNW